MTEQVRTKMLELFAEFSKPILDIKEEFEGQFTKEMVDYSAPFEDFLKMFDNLTLGSMGITQFEASNRYGKYKIDKTDYIAHKGAPFLEYIPDLGILDYLKSHIKNLYNNLPPFYIIVRFPRVRVTNENDRYIDIQELYAKTEIWPSGRFSNLFLIRSEYPMIQWLSRYSHSHIYSLDTSSAPVWRIPCLGRGPLSHTTRSLENNYDLNLWGLYTFELSKYVTTESLRGVPYIKLENVGMPSSISLILRNDVKQEYLPVIDSQYPNLSMKDFILYFISKWEVKMKYENGIYLIGENLTDFWIKVSNAMIEWINHKIGNVVLTTDIMIKFGSIREPLMRKCYIRNGYIYTTSGSTAIDAAANLEGTELFKFKGNPVLLHFTQINNEDANTSLLVQREIAEYIITKVQEIINYNYGRDKKSENN